MLKSPLFWNTWDFDSHGLNWCQTNAAGRRRSSFKEGNSCSRCFPRYKVKLHALSNQNKCTRRSAWRGAASKWRQEAEWGVHTQTARRLYSPIKALPQFYESDKGVHVISLTIALLPLLGSRISSACKRTHCLHIFWRIRIDTTYLLPTYH